MKWQKVLLASLPAVLTPLGIWGIWEASSGSEEAVVPSSSVSPSPSVLGSAPELSVPVTPSVPSVEEESSGAPLVVEESVASEVSSAEEVEGVRDAAYYQGVFQRLGGELSGHGLWRAFLAQPGALGVLVKAVEQLAGGERPVVFGSLEIMPQVSPFHAVPSGEGWVLSGETANRFRGVVEGICGSDPVKVAGLIKEIEPELDRILHEEYGYPPEQTFRGLLFECLEVILKTPVPSEPPRLVRVTSRLYRYEMAELESLNGAQKFVLRLGSANQQALQGYLRRLWEAL